MGIEIASPQTIFHEKDSAQKEPLNEALLENTYDSNIMLRNGIQDYEDECDKYFDFSNASSDYDEEFEDGIDSLS